MLKLLCAFFYTIVILPEHQPKQYEWQDTNLSSNSREKHRACQSRYLCKQDVRIQWYHLICIQHCHTLWSPVSHCHRNRRLWLWADSSSTSTLLLYFHQLYFFWFLSRPCILTTKQFVQCNAKAQQLVHLLFWANALIWCTFSLLTESIAFPVGILNIFLPVIQNAICWRKVGPKDNKNGGLFCTKVDNQQSVPLQGTQLNANTCMSAGSYNLPIMAWISDCGQFSKRGYMSSHILFGALYTSVE